MIALALPSISTGWTFLELTLKAVIDVRVDGRGDYTQHGYRLNFPGTGLCVKLRNLTTSILFFKLCIGYQ